MRDPDQHVRHPGSNGPALRRQPGAEGPQSFSQIEKYLRHFNVIGRCPLEVLALVGQLFLDLIGQMSIDESEALLAEFSVKECSCKPEGPEIEQQVIAAQIPLQVLGEERHLPGEGGENRRSATFSLSP